MLFTARAMAPYAVTTPVPVLPLLEQRWNLNLGTPTHNTTAAKVNFI